MIVELFEIHLPHLVPSFLTNQVSIQKKPYHSGIHVGFQMPLYNPWLLSEVLLD